jgi:peroxiredoxin
MKINIGDKAPDFTLFDSEKKELKLSDFNGKKVLLLFVPAAFTGTCTKEFCSMRDSISDYNNLNATVLGISCDSLFVLGKWKEEQNLNFTLLSDYNKTVTADYGCDYDNFVFGMKGNSKRSAFVIDENGIIAYAEVLEVATDLPNFEAIKAALN